MRSPSPRVLANLVDVYTGTLQPDREGGPGWSYPGAPSQIGVPCSVQPMEVAEVIDEQGRVTQVRDYDLMFGFDPGIRPRDKVVWRDVAYHRILFCQAVQDQAGRGAAFVVRATERLNPVVEQ